MKNTLSLFQWQHILSQDMNPGINPDCLTIKFIQGVSNAPGANKYLVAGCELRQELYDGLSDAVLELDHELNVLHSNKGANDLCEIGQEEVEGRSINEVLPSYIDTDAYQLFLSNATVDRGAANIYCKNRDGAYVLVRVTLLVRQSPDESIEGYTLLIQQREILQHEEVSDIQWHHLFETYPEPIAVVKDSAFIYVNTACANLYGATHKKQLLGASLFEFALVPYHKTLRKRLEIIASGERTTPIESRIRRLDGHVRYVRTYSVPIEYGGVKAAQIVISDITEQKRAVRALERSEKRFKALFERAGIGILLATHDARILETNPSFQRMVGYAGEELRDMSTHDITHEQDFPIQAQFYRQIHEGKIDRYRLEKRYIHKNKHVVWGSLTMAVIRDESGAVEYMIGMVEDISDRKKTEAELLAARNKAEEMTLLKSSFLTNMSHEIRTPLTGIMGFASILQDELSPAQVEIVRLIEQSGKRLLKTLDAILDLSMLESGTMPFEPKRVDVVDEVLHQVHLAEETAKGKELYIKVDYKSVDIFAFLERDYLARVLFNLISNAIKFTREGGVTVTLTVEDKDLIIEVADTGVGISESFIPLLFEAFRQESSGKTRTYDGTGLGLTIVKRLVDQMSGTIQVDSVLGEGSTFTVRLSGVVIEKQSRKKVEPQKNSIYSSKKSRPSVLVLDDNQDARRLLQKFLEGGYHVELVGEEKDALELAREHLFDVVLMDINLGGERTGVDALRALRHLSGYEQVPVVALTAYAVTGDRERFLKHGFDGYLGKPLTKKDLYNVIAGVLQSNN